MAVRSGRPAVSGGQHPRADAAALLVLADVHLGDLDAVGQPVRGQRRRRSYASSAAQTASYHHWPARRGSRSRTRAPASRVVERRWPRGAHLQGLEVGVAGVPAHQFPAARQQRRIGVHRVGVDGEQRRRARRGTLSAQGRIALLSVAIPPSVRDPAMTRRRLPGCAAPAKLSVPFDTFELSSKRMDSEPNLCSNTGVEAPGRPALPGYRVAAGRAWGSVPPGPPAGSGGRCHDHDRAGRPGPAAVQGRAVGAGAA